MTFTHEVNGPNFFFRFFIIGQGSFVRFKRSVMKGTFFGVSGFAQLQAMLTGQAEHSG